MKEYELPNSEKLGSVDAGTGPASSANGSESGMSTDSANEPWRVVYVEDNEVFIKGVKEFFESELIAGRKLAITFVNQFERALEEIRSRRVDLLLLDVSSGDTFTKVDKAGATILESVQETGFVCAVFYTAFPEQVSELRGHFVRVVSKTDGLHHLKAEIDLLFASRVPQMFRAIATHVDEVLRDYMWHFVVKSWSELAPIADKPAFLHVILNRLATTLSRDGVERVTDRVFGEGTGRPVAEERVHPAEYYVMPPINNDELLMGDVRVREVEDGTGGKRPEYLAVLWPSCDMVSSGGRKPKTDRVICVVASELAHEEEVQSAMANPGRSKKREALEKLIRNSRSVAPDRYHVLPSLCDVPDLILDFQRIEIISIDDVRGMRCLATVASPYAESLLDRFGRFIGRLGTPDIDASFIFDSLGVPKSE